MSSLNTFIFLLRCFLVADYSAQAVVNSILHESFPSDPIVGEEDSKDLRGETGRQMREKVLELANSGLEKALNEDSVCVLFYFHIQDSITKKKRHFRSVHFLQQAHTKGAAVDTLWACVLDQEWPRAREKNNVHNYCPALFEIEKQNYVLSPFQRRMSSDRERKLTRSPFLG